jgi:hypothetical protein
MTEQTASKAMLLIAAVPLTIATAAMGFTVPALLTLQGDMGSVKTTLASIDKRLEKIESKLARPLKE